MPRPCVAYPAYINGRGSRIFACAASGITLFLDYVIVILNSFASPGKESHQETNVKQKNPSRLSETGF